MQPHTPTQKGGNTYAFRYHCGYFITDPLSLTHGWWIKFPTAQSISYIGARTDSMRMFVCNGWNIIGSISSSIPASAPNVTSDPPGIIIPPFQTYQNGGYVIANTIEPGLGYWIKTSEAGRIVLKVGESGQGGGEEMESYDRFTLTDAEGRTQDLYVRNSSLVGTNESLEMPPPPPDAEFDARFSSGDIVRSVDPEAGVVDLSIAVNEATYPVTLSWAINPENGIGYSFLPGGGLGKTKANTTISGRGEAKFAELLQQSISLTAFAKGQHPSRYGLSQNYPNPFNPSTRIKFDLPEGGFVSLAVYNVLGQRVGELVSEYREAGFHSAVWNAERQTSGVYFARFNVTSSDGKVIYSKVNKLVLMK